MRAIPIDRLTGLSVLSIDSGRRLGKIKGVLIDPRDLTARYLRVDPEEGHHPRLIPWTAIHAIGEDAVTVTGHGSLSPEATGAGDVELMDRIGDRPVITEGGTHLGHVTGYKLDTSTGRIRSLEVAPEGFLATLTHTSRLIHGEQVRSIGPDAIIVEDRTARTAPQETTEDAREQADATLPPA